MPRGSLPRLLLGLLVSVAFLALVLARVDLAEVGTALRRANAGLLLLALGVVAVDVLVRAFRWRVLLGAIVPNPPGVLRAAAYLTIGYMANAMLPARLGDVARAYLAGTAFGAARLATFGTVLVERVSDGLMMVAVALVASVLVISVAQLHELQVQALVLVVGGLAVLGVLWLALRGGPLAATRIGAVARDLLGRLAAGAAALRTARGAMLVIGATAGAAVTSAVAWGVVIAAVGLSLAPEQVLLVSSATALSMAIPAAPSSLGPFEFVGVLVLTGFGATPEVGLAAVLLVRLVTTVPTALVGLVVTWATHLRPGALFNAGSSEGEPAGQGLAVE